MPQFTLVNYLLVLVSLLAHYPIGKRLGVRPFFSGVLVGISLSGILLGLLANIAAGLIRPLILLIILIGLTLLVKDYFTSHPKWNREIRRLYLFLIAVGLCLFVINNPAKLFLDKNDGQTLLRFNSHYSYYSSQSTEMLEAKYFSRLKIANLLPYEWSQYHFFNSGSRAATMGLIRTPGLFSYWIAQTLIVIFILLSFAETFLLYFGLKARNILALAIWLIFGFTLFANSVTWNLIATGPISVFAMIQLILAIYKQRWRQALIFTFVLGASAFRLLPIALISFLIILNYLIKTNTSFDQKINIRHLLTLLRHKVTLKPIDFGAGSFFIAYNLLTLISAKAIPSEEKLPFITDKVLDHGWLYILTSYKMTGYLYDQQLHLDRYYGFRDLGFFSKELDSPNLIRLLILLSGISISVCLYYCLKIYLTHYRLFNRYLIPVVLIAFHYYFLPKSIEQLHLILLPYFIVTILALYFINKKQQSNDWFLLQFLVLTYSATLLYQYLGVPSSIKAPVGYVTYDVALWGVLGLYLLVFAARSRVIGTALALAILAPLLFHFPLLYILKMPDTDSHSMKINISPLVSTDFERLDYVDDNNMVKFEFDNPNYDDAYSAILGANLNYSSKYSTFLNMSFVPR